VTETAGATARAQSGFGFYGWWAIVPAVFLILLVTNALTVGGIAAFDPSFISQLGVARADIKLGDAIQLGVTAFVTIGSGWLADRFGVRIVMATGAAALAWAFFSLAHVETLNDYYWSRFWMGVGLSGAGLAICVVAVSRWFLLRRGLALGIVLAGTSLGNAIFPRLFTELIERDGWQSAARVGGWLLIALLLVIAFVVKEWPDRLGLKPYGADLAAPGSDAQQIAGPELSYAQILGRREFWLIGIAAFATFYTILGYSNNMILHMQNLGVQPKEGSLLLVPLFLGGLVGKLAAGWLTDSFGRKPVWLVCLGLMLGGSVLFATLSAELAIVAASLMGLGWGANYTLLQAVLADVFGTRSLGRVMGAITVLDASGGALGPYVTARFADASGNYQSGFLLITGLLLVAFVCASLLTVATPDLIAKRAKQAAG